MEAGSVGRGQSHESDPGSLADRNTQNDSRCGRCQAGNESDTGSGNETVTSDEDTAASAGAKGDAIRKKQGQNRLRRARALSIADCGFRIAD